MGARAQLRERKENRMPSERSEFPSEEFRTRALGFARRRGDVRRQLPNRPKQSTMKRKTSIVWRKLEGPIFDGMENRSPTAVRTAQTGIHGSRSERFRKTIEVFLTRLLRPLCGRGLAMTVPMRCRRTSPRRHHARWASRASSGMRFSFLNSFVAALVHPVRATS